MSELIMFWLAVYGGIDITIRLVSFIVRAIIKGHEATTPMPDRLRSQAE